MAIATELHETAHGVWTWHAFDESIRTELSSTAVLAEEGLVIIDPIASTNGILTRLGKIAAVAAVVLTNGNHSRDAARYRERFSAPVFSHPEAVGELMLPIDRTLHVGGGVGGDLRVLGLAGAGPGEVVLYREGSWLHLGDAIINLEDTGLAVLPEKYCLDSGLLSQSLQELTKMSFHGATFAHGAPILADAGTLIHSLIRGCRSKGAAGSDASQG